MTIIELKTGNGAPPTLSKGEPAFDTAGSKLYIGNGVGNVLINPTVLGVVPAAGTQTLTSGTVFFSNANGISFGLNGSVLTASGGGGGGNQTAISGISAGTTQATSGTISFANSNGVSFGINGNTLTASISSQTNQTVGLYGIGNTTQNSSTTLDARTLSFDGLGGVSVGFSNGSIQISGPQTLAQTVQTLGLYGVGNTTQNSSTTLDARTLSFDGLGAATVGFSNGSIQISAPVQTAQTQNVVVPSAGTQTATSGTVIFSNSNGISFGMSNSSVITASYTVPSVPAQTNQTLGLYGVGNTTQNSSTTLDARTISFDGLGAATVGFSNGSVQISVPTQTAQTQSLIQAIYDGANSITTGTIRLTNANGVSFSINGQTLSASVAAQTNQTIGLYGVGNTTQNSSTTLDARTLSFDGLGAATVGFSNGSIQISAPVQTNQSVGLYGLGNTTQNSSTTLDARTLSFNGLGGITVGYSNGSIQLSGPVAQTNQTDGFYAVGNTTQNSSTTLDARTISFGGRGDITVGYSNGTIQISGAQTAQTQSLIQAIYDGANSITTGTIRLTNANGVSFSINGQTLSASVAAQTNQTVGLYALGNTTQNSSTTLDARSLSFNGLGAITVGYSNGSIQISAPSAAAGNVTFSAGTASGGLGSVVFSNSNGVSFGLNGSTVTGSVAAQTNQTVGLYAIGNTTQNSSTTLDARTLSFNGLGIITAGYSNGSIQLSATVAAQTNQSIGFYAVGNTTQNSSTTLDARTISFDGLGAQTVGFSNGSIQLSVPATSSLVGTAGISISTNGSTISVSYLGQSQLNDYAPWPLIGSTLTSYGQNTLNLGAFYPPQNVSMNNVAILISLNNQTSALSHAVSETISYALYSKGTGASSTIISRMASSSILLAASYSGVLSGGYTISAGANSTTYSSAGTGSTSVWTGQKIFSLPFATSISGNAEYWFGLANSTNSVGNVSALRLSYMAASGISNASWGNLATNTINVPANSIVPNQFGAIFSVTSASWPATIAFSDMSNQVSNLVPYIFMGT